MYLPGSFALIDVSTFSMILMYPSSDVSHLAMHFLPKLVDNK